MNRRTLLLGVAGVLVAPAIVGAWLGRSPIEDDTPRIVCDGRHDDTDGLYAFIAGKPVLMGYGCKAWRSDAIVDLGGGTYFVRDDFTANLFNIVRPGMTLQNAVFLGTQAPYDVPWPPLVAIAARRRGPFLYTVSRDA